MTSGSAGTGAFCGSRTGTVAPWRGCTWTLDGREGDCVVISCVACCGITVATTVDGVDYSRLTSPFSSHTPPPEGSSAGIRVRSLDDGPGLRIAQPRTQPPPPITAAVTQQPLPAPNKAAATPSRKKTADPPRNRASGNPGCSCPVSARGWPGLVGSTRVPSAAIHPSVAEACSGSGQGRTGQDSLNPVEDHLVSRGVTAHIGLYDAVARSEAWCIRLSYIVCGVSADRTPLGKGPGRPCPALPCLVLTYFLFLALVLILLPNRNEWRRP